MQYYINYRNLKVVHLQIIAYRDMR